MHDQHQYADYNDLYLVQTHKKSLSFLVVIELIFNFIFFNFIFEVSPFQISVNTTTTVCMLC